MTSILFEKDKQGIGHIIFDRPGSPVNLMDLAFADDLTRVVQQALASDCIGFILRSNKTTFFAGGDLAFLAQTTRENGHILYQMSMQMKAAMRALETCAKPVVACINGSALGGGFELALACHQRICVDNPKIQLGLPEVTLGLLPGAGGVTRLVRLLGLQQAKPYLIEGQLFNPQQGLQAGLIHRVVADEAALLAAAADWIGQCSTALQPYDQKSYQIPGGKPGDPALANSLALAPVLVQNKTKGTLPAPQTILNCMVEGAQVDFANAEKIESRYFVELARSAVCKNLINTFWFQLNAIKAGGNRPADQAKTRFSRIGVVGAGMMGAGIAYVCARKGISVVLMDRQIAIAEQGKQRCGQLLARQLLEKQQAPGQTDAQPQPLLDLIQVSDNVADFADCELVIEAVYEDLGLKTQLIQQIEAVVASDTLIASNTSTIPISQLALASGAAERLIGIHFFSPVDKMPLVEMICGEQTNQPSVAKAYDLAIQLGKTPIVVNDGAGFYTSRVFATYVKEGIAMLSQTSAAAIENAAYLAGFPTGPLVVSDEVSLGLLATIIPLTLGASSGVATQLDDFDAECLTMIQTLLDQGRSGKASGAGFYDYGGDHGKALWPALAARYQTNPSDLPLADIKDRLLFIMALETVHCYEQGILRSVGEANIGSIYGIGFPRWTGGTLQFINQYPLVDFVARAQQLASRYGPRFLPSATLVNMATEQRVY